VELLRKLLSGEIKTRGWRNVVQTRSFPEMVGVKFRRYQHRESRRREGLRVHRERTTPCRTGSLSTRM